ncbi:MAG: thioredoxin [Anaerolineae bacterium]
MGLFKRFAGGAKSAPDDGNPAAEPRHVTGEEFDTVVLQSELPAVVDFWAEWCGPCHAIAPAVAQLAVEYEGRALVAKLNADEYPEILMRYGIMGIPTLIFFKNGQEVDRQVGMTSYSTLKNKLERVLA